MSIPDFGPLASTSSVARICVATFVLLVPSVAQADDSHGSPAADCAELLEQLLSFGLEEIASATRGLLDERVDIDPYPLCVALEEVFREQSNSHFLETVDRLVPEMRLRSLVSISRQREVAEARPVLGRHLDSSDLGEEVRYEVVRTFASLTPENEDRELIALLDRWAPTLERGRPGVADSIVAGVIRGSAASKSDRLQARVEALWKRVGRSLGRTRTTTVLAAYELYKDTLEWWEAHPDVGERRKYVARRIQWLYIHDTDMERFIATDTRNGIVLRGHLQALRKEAPDELADVFDEFAKEMPHLAPMLTHALARADADIERSDSGR